MHATILSLVALFATSVFAQGKTIPGLPQCVQGCITDYGGCNQVDVKCICSNKPLLTRLSCCVAQNCDEAGTAQVISFADSLCGSYGVTTLPTAATCASTASSKSSSSTSTAVRTASPTASAATTKAPSSSPTPSGSRTSVSGLESSASAATSSPASASPTAGSLAVKNSKAEGLVITMAVFAVMFVGGFFI